MSALVALVATAVPALAQGSSVTTNDDPPVLGDVVTPPSGTAFTGGDLVPWMLAIAVLLAVGITLLLVSRRRRLTATS
ncbi:MAG: LPXTG cell wall anchor domain-containing protein [Actinomycetota bacterium]